MFGRIQPVKNRNAIYAEAAGADGGGEAIVDDLHVQRACREFLGALQAYSAFNPEASSAIRPEPTPDRQDLEDIAYEKMELALKEVRSLRASHPVGLQAKFEALFVLEDRFSTEDFRVVGFAMELAREAYALLADQVTEDKPFRKLNSGSSCERREGRLSFPRLLRFIGEPKSTMPSGTRRSQS